MLKKNHLAYEIAHGGENGTSNFGTGTQVFLQGMVGGTASHLRGGRFQDGFMGAVVSKGVDLGLKGQNLNMYQEGSITVIAGGLASQAAGGSFEDGAIQAGMVFLYNSSMERKWINPTGKGVRSLDKWGDGEFGASRGTRTHKGVDYVAEPDQDIVAPTSGKVSKIGYPYSKNLSYRYIQISTEDGYVVRVFYVSPAESINVGSTVDAGQKIGIYQSLQPLYDGITDHVHLEIYHNNELQNPNNYIK